MGIFDIKFTKTNTSESPLNPNYKNNDNIRVGTSIGDFNNQQSTDDMINRISSNTNKDVIKKRKKDIVNQLKVQKVQEVAIKNNHHITNDDIKQKQEQIISQQIVETKNELKDIVVEELTDKIVNKKIKKNKPIKEKKIKETVEKVVNNNIDSITEAIVNTPNMDMDNIETKIKSDKRKEKGGYYKLQVSIKKESIPEIVNKIASYVKRETKGIVVPRVSDLRVIGNTNKTQLRNSELKLTQTTITFKPRPEVLKVNKGTRFMISIPENFETTGDLIIYIQQSRAKQILIMYRKEFTSEQHFIEFIGDRCAEFFYQGYDMCLSKMNMKVEQTPIIRLASMIVKTGNYKAKPIFDEHYGTWSVQLKPDFVNDNEWLSLLIETNTQDPTLYDMWAYEERVMGRYELHNGLSDNPVSFKWLNDNLLSVIDGIFEDEYPEITNISEQTKIEYKATKLTHTKLKKLFFDINNLSKEFPELEIEIKQVGSKMDMRKLFKKPDYDGECIMGKTNMLKFFGLTYFAYQIIGGDKRKGSEYITTDDYRTKYSVSDKRGYDKRERTILKREGVERNYNSRPYIFQLEYILNNSDDVVVYRTKSLEALIEVTKFLTDKPNMNAKSEI